MAVKKLSIRVDSTIISACWRQATGIFHTGDAQQRLDIGSRATSATLLAAATGVFNKLYPALQRFVAS